MSLTEGLIDFKDKCDVAMNALVATKTLDLQNYMRTHYPWTPRSHRANRTMSGSYKKEDDGFLISLAYAVDYGVFLELAHEKKYALTKPTAELKGPEVIKAFEHLIDKL